MAGLRRLLRLAPWLPKAAAAGFLACAILAFLLAQFGPRRYVCEWSMLLPSSDTEARVSLADVGQASAGARSFLDGRVLDHRVNYRQMMLGPTVRRAAADVLDTDPGALPTPRIRLLDQSSIFTFELRGRDPDILLRVSEAWLEAFQQRVQSLRADEAQIRRQALMTEIQRARGALAASSGELSEFRRRTGLISEEQLELTVSRLDRVQENLLQRSARLASLDAVVELGLTPLGLDETQSRTALTLVHDGVFMEVAARWRDAEADLLTRASHWGPRHPLRLELKEESRRALARLVELGETRLGRPLSKQELTGLFTLLSRDATRDALKHLGESVIDRHALAGESTHWRRELQGLEEDLDRQVAALAELAVLESTNGLNQALLTSIQAQADIGGSKPFASYPLVQVLEPPRRPEQPIRLHPLLWIVAVLGATGMWSVALVLVASELVDGRP